MLKNRLVNTMTLNLRKDRNSGNVLKEIAMNAIESRTEAEVLEKNIMEDVYHGAMHVISKMIVLHVYCTRRRSQPWKNGPKKVARRRWDSNPRGQSPMD